MKFRILLVVCASLFTLSTVVAFQQGAPGGVRSELPGDPDISFGDQGAANIIQLSGKILALAVDSQGRIVVGGFSISGGKKRAMVGRFTPAGTLDGSFGIGAGKFSINFRDNVDEEIFSLALDNAGNIIAGGYTTFADGSQQIALTRIKPDGQLDATFGNRGKQLVQFLVRDQWVAKKILVGGDGKILIAGYKIKADGNRDIFLGRLSANGTVDATFGLGNAGYVEVDIAASSDEHIDAMGLASDGTLFVGGAATLNGKFKRLIGSFTADGKIHEFRIEEPASDNQGVITDLKIDSSGKIVVCGSVGAFPNLGFMVARYNPDKSPDDSFGDHGRTVTDLADGNDKANTLFFDSDNKIILGGYAEKKVGNVSEKQLALVRYNADGNLDESFGDHGKVITDAVNSSQEEIAAVAVTGNNQVVSGGFVGSNQENAFFLAEYLGSAAKADVAVAPNNGGGGNGPNAANLAAPAGGGAGAGAAPAGGKGGGCSLMIPK